MPCSEGLKPHLVPQLTVRLESRTRRAVELPQSVCPAIAPCPLLTSRGRPTGQTARRDKGTSLKSGRNGDAARAQPLWLQPPRSSAGIGGGGSSENMSRTSQRSLRKNGLCRRCFSPPVPKASEPANGGEARERLGRAPWRAERKLYSAMLGPAPNVIRFRAVNLKCQDPRPQVRRSRTTHSHRGFMSEPTLCRGDLPRRRRMETDLIGLIERHLAPSNN